MGQRKSVSIEMWIAFIRGLPLASNRRDAALFVITNGAANWGLRTFDRVSDFRITEKVQGSPDARLDQSDDRRGPYCGDRIVLGS